MKFSGKQVGVIVLGGGINGRVWADEYKARGYVVVYRGDHITIHEAATA